MNPTEGTAVAVELAQMRGTIDTGLAKVDGKLEVLMQRDKYTEQRITAQEKAHATLVTRVAGLESARWPLPTIGALAGLAGVATALFALFQR